ncbi:barstar family protein [Allosphingosinicella sp.]|uniref:barstar family protein n=1 Tax=Allosphingosinicella sp. TaxID=2823234 RepID=UPI002FC0F24E
MSDAIFTLCLDGERVQSEDLFHQEIKQQTGIEWYGSNLDALDEMLASIIPETCGPFRVIWENADLSHQGFGQRYLMVVGMMKEMQQRFPDRFLDFRMTFSEPYFDEGQDPFLRPNR